MSTTQRSSKTQRPSNVRSERRFSASRFDVPDDDFDIDADDQTALRELENELQSLKDEHRARRCRTSPSGASNVVPSPTSPTRSIEVFPARNASRLRRNVAAVRTMLKLGTDFVTVTYGAAGSRPAGTKELVGWLVEAGVPTYAHLTCVADNLAALDATIDELLELGVTGILALRGDLPIDGSQLVLPHATDLIGRIRTRVEQARQSLNIAAAAYPTGHPDSPNLAADAEDVARKQAAGADFAITQNFFRADDYAHFVSHVRHLGCTLPVVPGLTPATSVRRLERIAELSAQPVPEALNVALHEASTPAARRDIAVHETVELARTLVLAGAPGIQLFTMNDDVTANRILAALDPTFEVAEHNHILQHHDPTH